jgi:3-hydroxyacyl-CoA dehydrogenase
MTDETAALRHIATAESAAAALGESGGDDIVTAVVIGGGTMGAAIAYALAQVGVTVALVETNPAGVERARTNVAELYSKAVARGKISAESAETALRERHAFHIGYDHLPQVELAIEAVFENLDVKRQVFATLDARLGNQAILATNTSYLDPNRIAEGLHDPGRFLGLHFFSPAHIMKLVEVVRTRDTSTATLETVLRLTRRLGKLPVLAGVCDGFIGNRILTRYRQTCDVMLVEGALPHEIDAAMRGFGMAMGPYEVQDLSGLDIAYANRKRLGWATDPGRRYIAIADRIVDETGRLGRKTGGGWYDYIDGKPVPASIVTDIVIEESTRVGIARRAFAAEEIVQRATDAMAIEGAAIVAEGIAANPADVDLTFVNGYGFPRTRGGPMYHAAEGGYAALLGRIEGYAEKDPLSWPLPECVRRAAKDIESGAVETIG